MQIISKEISSFYSNTQVWVVRSSAVGDDFRVVISGPETPIAAGATPGVVITTDADYFAGYVPATLRSIEISGELPQLWAVSIGYPIDADIPHLLKRNRDLSPSSHALFDEFIPAMLGFSEGTTLPTGGANAFLSFIIDELKPVLAEEFPMDVSDATIVGSSLGGLFATYAMISHPQEFPRALASAPAYFFKNQMIFETADEVKSAGKSFDNKVYLCAGEYESKEHTTEAIAAFPPEQQEAVKKVFGDTDVHSLVERMANTLGEWPGVDVKSVILPDETHNSINGAALSRGLRWLYRD